MPPTRSCMIRRRTRISISCYDLVMKNTSKLSVMIAAVFCLGLVVQSFAQDQPSGLADAKEFSDRVRAITSSSDSKGRLAAVTKLLDDLEVPFRVEDFKLDDAQGKNLFVDLVKGPSNKILLGAHFDQVKVGQGAIDNASSCAVLVEMIERFKAKPLKNYSLEVVFFDLEEAGLIGSKAYADKLGKDAAPKHFINVDIFGYGDTLWLMSAENKEAAVQKAFAQAGKAADFPVVTSDAKEYPPGDHLSLMKAGVSTLAVALIDKSEIEPIKSLLAGKRVAPPPILRTIHTPDDNVAKIDSKECSIALPVIEAAIRSLDENSTPNTKPER